MTNRIKWKILNMADTSWCPEVLEPLKQYANIITLKPTRKNLLNNIDKFNAYIASLYVRLDKEILDRAKRLRVIVTPSTGTDHIDIKTAIQKNIVILSLKNDTDFLDSITATAELTWALLLATIRKIPWAFEAAKSGFWARDRFRGHQLSGKTLGILGYGRLGRIIGQYAKAFRMNVIAHDIRSIDEIRPEEYIEIVTFKKLLHESDILTIHIHLTEENRNLINLKTLSEMKKGAILINTSRGAIIDEQALIDALNSGQISAAGLDVIHGEWNTNLKEHPLIKYANTHENLIISPHIGGVTYESQKMTLEFSINKLIHFIKENNV